MNLHSHIHATQTHTHERKEGQKKGRKKRERKYEEINEVGYGGSNLSTGDLKVGELLAHGQPELCRNFQARLGYMCISTVYQNLERKQARKESSRSDGGKEDWQE